MTNPAPARALVSATVRSNKPVAFVVGSAISLPDSPDTPGVPGTDGMIKLVRQCIETENLSVEDFDRDLASCLGAQRYQRAMWYLTQYINQDAVNEVIVEAVQHAQRNGKWHVTKATRDLANLVVNHSKLFPGPILTTNFDPLLSEGIKEAGGQAMSVYMDGDGRLARGDFSGQPPVEIVYLHGFWKEGTDTLHTTAQLTAPRARLGRTLQDILSNHTVLVVGYAGWDDIFTTALMELVRTDATKLDVLWAFHEKDASEIEVRYRELLSKARPVLESRFRYYSGVDCRQVFADISDQLNGQRSDQRTSERPGRQSPSRAMPTIRDSKTPRRSGKQTRQRISKKTAPRTKPIDKWIKLAIAHIARFGDTDIFPFPVEKQIFREIPDKVATVVKEMHDHFERTLQGYPIRYENLFTSVGYQGFRLGTQIDPFWHAYFLALTLALAKEIEAARIPVAEDVVFSYRFKPNQTAHTLFNPDIGWARFQETVRNVAESVRDGALGVRHSPFVLICDVTDYYPRIHHELIRRSLNEIALNMEFVDRLITMLGRLAGGGTYGLPVGGNAARILSELFLSEVDKHLQSSKVRFCRFVDDFHVFCPTREDAHKCLIELSALLDRLHLSLQKNKTRIMTVEEYLADRPPITDDAEPDTQEFLKLRLNYDPYADDPESDYARLTTELQRFDILKMLGRELRKSRVDQALARKLIKAVKLIEKEDVRDKAVDAMFDNMEVLYPVFPTVMTVTKGVLGTLGKRTTSKIFSTLRKMVSSGSYCTQVPVHLAYAVRLLGHDNTKATGKVLDKLFREESSAILRRDVILAMARRRESKWLAKKMQLFDAFDVFERRALLVASWFMKEEGDTWRNSKRADASAAERVVIDWVDANAGRKDWEVPL